MSAWLFPYQSLVGNAVWGSIIPATGIICGAHFETNNSEPNNPILAWSHNQLTGLVTADRCVRIYRDGDLEQTVAQSKSAIVQTVYPSVIVRYDIEPLSVLESETTETSNGFAINPIGDRVKISWPKCTASDFDAYLVLWNQGVGIDPFATIDTIQGSDNTVSISPQLTNGTTYKFGLKFRDVHGNTSALGTVYSVTADIPPLAISNPTLSYNSSTRKATISGAHSASQHTDVAGVALHDNYVPAYALGEYPNVEYEMRRQFSYVKTAGSPVSFVTQELHVGQWKFSMRAVDKWENMSDYTTLTLNIKTDGTRGSVQPLMPTGLIAYATESAAIVIKWDHDGGSTTKFRIYKDGSFGTAVSTNLTTSPHTYTYAGLSDATSYSFQISAANGGLESTKSAAATATADGAAPTGSKALTLEMVR